jgi:mono/diheme cytochrome c family protein
MASKRFGARRIVGGLVILALIGLGLFWLVTIPSTLPASALPAGYKPDLANGEKMFTIGGCVSCHKSVGQDDRLKLGGGLGLKSPFGTFRSPNISTDKTHGIGGWSELAFVNALMRGVGRNGEHLFPALPYTSYQRMKIEDVRDLWGYVQTLPAVAEPSKPHEVGFPFDIRRSLGGWKLLFMDRKPFAPDPSKDAAWNRGAYLVEGPGHCAECHSPRNLIGGIKSGERFAGGIDVETSGWVPNITPHADGIGGWSQSDIAEFLKTGFTPEFDSAGGSMAQVIQNTSRLTDEDRAAMASYIATLPARPGKAPVKAGAKTP